MAEYKRPIFENNSRSIENELLNPLDSAKYSYELNDSVVVPCDDGFHE